MIAEIVNSTSMIIEIRASEGGDDAKSLVLTQVDIYTRLVKRSGLL
jgi:protein subunit release factor A